MSRFAPLRRQPSSTDAVPPKVRPHHLKLWYVLADLYDRAGESPRARALFRRIREHDCR